MCFSNATATPDIYTLSLHDALPISEARRRRTETRLRRRGPGLRLGERAERVGDRKSTRLNSSHVEISYAVFCLKKKSIGQSSAWRCFLTPRAILAPADRQIVSLQPV